MRAMSNEYDMEGVHKYVRFTDALLQRDTYFNETTDPTKMNVIVPIIPRPARDIMDLALLTTGVGLNALLGLSILLNSCMRTTANCYMTSLMCSNLIILIEPLQQVLRWIFDVRLVLNLDYVFLVTFDVSVLTITQLNIEAYVVICYKDSPLREPLLRISTAVKGVLLIWVICVMLTCTELHLYEHFEEEVMYDICVSSTVIFLMFPCFIFLMLDYFILHDLVTTRSADGTWPSEDVERFVLLGERLTCVGQSSRARYFRYLAK